MDNKRYVESNHENNCYFYLSKLKSLFSSKLNYSFTLEVTEFFYADENMYNDIDFEDEYWRCLRITAKSPKRKYPEYIDIH